MPNAPSPGDEDLVRRVRDGADAAAMSQAHTGADGVARLQGLDPQQLYRLGVDPNSDRRTDLKEERIHDWKPADTSVQLERK